MKKYCFTFFATFLLIFQAATQSGNLELTFTARSHSSYVQLDSIQVQNMTQSADTILYWPDTVLSFQWVGMADLGNLYQETSSIRCYPNPARHHSVISIYLSFEDEVQMNISDLRGKIYISQSFALPGGLHSFSFTPGKERIYICEVKGKSVHKAIKIINLKTEGEAICTLSQLSSDQSHGTSKEGNITTGFSFDPGDSLLMKGFFNGMESGIMDAPEESNTYEFQFASGIFCPGTPSVVYEGVTYYTVQIFSQCWFQENLNVGLMIDGTLDQTNNDTIERFCLYNSLDSCAKYGGLYQWDELMAYANTQGTQGICPEGWHIPTIDDWKLLEGAADSQYGMGDPQWDLFWMMRGSDVGLNLKSRNYWFREQNGVNSVGFSAMPGGQRSQYAFFGWETRAANFWSSTEAPYNSVWYIHLIVGSDQSALSNHFKEWGFSVRCIMD